MREMTRFFLSFSWSLMDLTIHGMIEEYLADRSRVSGLNRYTTRTPLSWTVSNTLYFWKVNILYPDPLTPTDIWQFQMMNKWYI